jgi:hypothetical protein
MSLGPPQIPYDLTRVPNPGHRDGNSATKSLSYGTALVGGLNSEISLVLSYAHDLPPFSVTVRSRHGAEAAGRV